MQLCESCGACRENEWRVCPFCRAPLAILDIPTSTDGERFDALAAAAEVSELDVLPSLIIDEDDEPEPDNDLITAQDLAHLTGDGGPAANAWETPTTAAPTAPAESDDGIDAPVSRAVVVPLIAVALAAVAFVAYSIITAPPPTRPDAVALIDIPTTTAMPTTTSEAPQTAPRAVGVDIAEQAAWLCAGDQFSIARAEAPSLAVYNDLLVATRDGRDDWMAPADHMTLREPVPSLIGCLTTADGGEIDRCPTNTIISRRSVLWTYRVVQSIDGTTLGFDEGTATDLRPCDELLLEAAGEDSASWSPLPQDRLNQVAAAYTAAPHPQAACTAASDIPQADVPEPVVFEQGAPVHATFNGMTADDAALPKGWQATAERPVEAVLCLEYIGEEEAPPTTDVADDEPVDNVQEDPATVNACGVTIRVHAMHRDGRTIGSWDYVSSTCPDTSEQVTPTDDWWTSVVGPNLGYPVDSPETEGS